MDDTYDKHMKQITKDWLASRQTSLWGRTFDVIQEDSREKAADYWLAQLESFDKFYDAYPES